MPSKEEVRKARSDAGLTQDEAGKVVGTGWKTWQRWEYGKSKMSSGLWELYLTKTKSARKKSGA